MLSYEESLLYLNSDDDKEPAGGSHVAVDILSYDDTFSFLDGDA